MVIGLANKRDNEQVLVVYCTAPDQAVASNIAKQLVADRRAACVNILPGVQSIYHWAGQICSDKEMMLMIKTTRAKYAELEAALLDMHPYELPELIALPIETGSQKYLSWVEDSVKSAHKIEDSIK